MSQRHSVDVYTIIIILREIKSSHAPAAHADVDLYYKCSKLNGEPCIRMSSLDHENYGL